MADRSEAGLPPEAPDTPDIGALVEAYSKGDLVSWLRDHEAAEYLIGLVAEETGIRRIYVRTVYNLLVGLVVSRGEAGVRKLAGRLASATADLVRRTPFYDRIAHGLLGLEDRLRREESLKARLEALTTGKLRPGAFGPAEGLSREARLGLRILEEQEALWTDLGAAFDDVRGRLNPRPPLTCRILGAGAGLEANRFRFNARRLSFVGHRAEVGALDAFLGSERRFCWWLATGPGGIGKSRLALEACLRHAVDWRSGFLRRETAYDGWDAWQPEANTLIVLDYAGSQVERARRIVTAMRDRERELDAPVRLLLLERRAEGEEWWRRLLTPDATGAEIRDSCFRPDAAPLALGPLADDDLWAVVLAALADAGAEAPDRDAALGELRRIDPEGRPLFAALAGDALAAGHSLRRWDRARLLEDVLARERERIWPPDTSPAELNLLALATMCGPLPVAEAEKLAALPILPPGFLPDFDPDAGEGAFDGRRYMQMAGRALDDHPEQGPLLPPLGPDVVGEFFVLRHCVDQGGRVLRRRVERLRAAARALERPYALAFGRFVGRCADDFLDEPALAELASPPADLDDVKGWHAWCLSALGLIDAYGRAGRLDDAVAVDEAVRRFAERGPEDERAGAVSVVLGGRRVRLLVAAGRVREAEAVVARVVALARSRPGSPDVLSSAMAASAALVPAHAAEGRHEDACAVYEELAAAAADPAMAGLRINVAMTARRLIPALAAAGRVDLARAAYERFAGLILADPAAVEGQDLRLAVASEASRLVAMLLREDRVEDARGLGEHLRGLVLAWPVPGVRADAARGVLDLVLAEAGAGRPAEAGAAHAWLAELAAAHPGEPDLRLAFSAGGRAAMIACARAGRGSEALSLCDLLATSAAAHADELEPRLSLLTSATDLQRALEDAGLAALSPGFEERLLQVVEAEPTIAELRRATAESYAGLLDRAIAGDRDFTLQVLGLGGTLAAARGDDEAWLASLRGVLEFLIGLADLGNETPDLAAAWRVRGTPEAEREIGLRVARAAAAVADVLSARGRVDEAAAVAGRAESFLRPPGGPSVPDGP